MLPRRRAAKTDLARWAGALSAAAALLVTGALSLSCDGTLPRPVFSPQSASALVAVSLPPPPGRIEVIPPRPRSYPVWVDGEWVWRRRRWAWLPGRWVQAPVGATFSPWVFVRGRDGRLWTAPGVWRDARGRVLPSPPALAAAQVEPTQVVNSEADVVVTGPTLPPGGAPNRNRATTDAGAGPSASADAG